MHFRKNRVDKNENENDGQREAEEENRTLKRKEKKKKLKEKKFREKIEKINEINCFWYNMGHLERRWNEKEV